MTPQVVLQASGHVERFTDLMVTDALTGEPYRADHLLEHHLEALLEDKKKPLSADDTEVRSILIWLYDSNDEPLHSFEKISYVSSLSQF